MSIKTSVKAAKNVVSSKMGRQILVAQKNSPTLLIGVGVVGTVATAVLASRATLQLEDILNEHSRNQHKADQALEHMAEYTEKAHKRDSAVLKSRLIVEIGKLYGPAIIVGGVTIASIAGSHVIMSRRNAGLVAAYAAVDKAFSEYRERVLKEVGPEKELELRYNLTDREVAVDTEKGTEVEVIKTPGEQAGYSRFAKLFGRDTTTSWTNNQDYNVVFLRCQQNYANDRLQSRGHLFLNEVYDMLGLEHTREGSVVGWLAGDKGVDNFVDFGVFEDQDRNSFHDFMTGQDNSVWLDFNVDGTIWDKI